jgi:uncharacterized protein (DUF2249 family)
MSKYADLVFTVDIRDYGWFHEYRPACDKLETVYERVRYGGRTADGKEFEGWMEVPRTIVVHYPAHYDISDSAAARFTLQDTRSGKIVWQFTDTRTRNSFAIGKSYDRTGRIDDEPHLRRRLRKNSPERGGAITSRQAFFPALPDMLLVKAQQGGKQWGKPLRQLCKAKPVRPASPSPARPSPARPPRRCPDSGRCRARSPTCAGRCRR